MKYILYSMMVPLFLIVFIYLPLGVILSDNGNPLSYWSRFSIGDCLIHGKTIESWQNIKPDYQVLQIGKQSYKVYDFYSNTEKTISMKYSRAFLNKTKCNL